LDPFVPYLQARWQAGCTNGVQLWRELQDRGYPGSRKLVARWVQQPREQPAPTTPTKYLRQRTAQPAASTPTAAPPLAPRQVAWLLVRRPDRLTDEDRGRLSRLCAARADLDRLYRLAQAFGALVRERHAERLDAWLDEAEGSGLPELQTFAQGLRRDEA